KSSRTWPARCRRDFECRRPSAMLRRTQGSIGLTVTAPSVAGLLDLTGRVALVTGASAGIGRGIARRLAEAGAAVAVHYRSGRTDAERLVAEIGERGGKTIAVPAELTDPAAVESALKSIETAL